MRSEDTIRVLRIVEYVGLRSEVEDVVANSIHGIKETKRVKITATTLGEFPEILNKHTEETSL
jgi:hypothetical protein